MTSRTEIFEAVSAVLFKECFSEKKEIIKNTTPKIKHNKLGEIPFISTSGLIFNIKNDNFTSILKQYKANKPLSSKDVKIGGKGKCLK